MRAAFRSILGGWLVASLMLLGAPAQAGMIGTEQLVAGHSDALTVSAFVAREDVRAQLEAWGVDPVVASARVDTMTPEELRSLAQGIESQPAGGGALGVIGAVFLVLLILELVGVIDVFKKV